MAVDAHAEAYGSPEPNGDGQQPWSDAQARFLAAAGATLAASLDYEQVLGRLAALAVPILGDWCAVALVEPNRPLRRVTLAYADPALRPLAEAIERLPLNEQHTYAYTQALTTGQPVLFEYPADLTELQAWLLHSPEHLRLTQQMAPRCSYTVPLKVHGQTYGAISYIMTSSERTFTAERRALAEELARRAAVAVDNALLYRDAQRRLTELILVQQVAHMMSGAFDPAMIGQTVVTQIQAAFGYPHVSIYLREGDSLVLQAQVGYPSTPERVSINSGVIGRVVRRAETVFLPDTSRDPDYPMSGIAIRQAIFVPLCYADGPALGVISIESSGDPRLTDEDLRMLSLLADQLSVALMNTRLFVRLDDAASRWRTLVETAAHVVICLDLELRITEFNQRAEQIFGITRHEALGCDYMLTFVAPPDRIPLVGLIAAALADQRPSPLELMVEHSRGVRYALLWTLTCRRTTNGAPLELLLVGQDVTERRTAEQARLVVERKMFEAQRLESLGVLVGGLAHDFNNLLAAILGNASLLLLDLPATSEAYQSAAQIELISQRAAELVSQMLAYAGRGYFEFQSIDLNALLNEMLVLIHASIRKDALLQTHIDPELAMVEADPVQLRQVLMNLLINASEALGPEGGQVTLTTALRTVHTTDLATAVIGAECPAGLYVALTVQDTGLGMDAAILNRIFEPFFTTKFTGRGLGLAAVLGIVRSHNGVLFAQSTPGAGSCFTVLLPACSDAPALPTIVHDAPLFAAPAHSHSAMILVIDDEDDVRSMLIRVLERGGFATASAPDGEQGLILSRGLAAHLAAVVLDLTMPRLNGEQVFRILQQERPDLPVVLISGFPTDEIAARFGEQRPAAILQKPFGPSTLLSAVRQVLA